MKYLGTKADFEGLDTFESPSIHSVSLVSDEVSAKCPITEQPDWYTVSIQYEPDRVCLETKSLKMYFQALQDVGIFCEDLCEKIFEDVCEALDPLALKVTVTQKSRGGITTSASKEMSL